jgi:flavodoxin
MMKTLVACYSFTGNTWKIAGEVKDIMDADITRIDTVVAPNWDMKCMSEWVQDRARIKPCQEDMGRYDLLVIATPVWAWLPPPAVNEYIAGLKNVKGKKFAVMATAGKCGFEDVINDIKGKLEAKGMEFMGSGQFFSGDIACGDYRSKAAEFVKSLKMPVMAAL